jgi:cell shape-determining protein MreC
LPHRRTAPASTGPRARTTIEGEPMSANTKKILIVAAVALVLFFLITKPTQSADVVHNVLGWLRNGAEAIVTFVRSLFS